MPSIKYYVDKKGMMSAKIQAYCRNILVPNKKVYFYKRIYNDKNLSEEKFKKNVVKFAYQFETEETLKYEQKALPFLEEKNKTLEKIKEIQDLIKESELPPEERKEKFIPSDKVLTFEELSDEWIAHVLKDFSVGYYTRGLRTLSLFKEYLEKRELANKPISDIKVRDIQMFLNGFEGQSVSTVRGHKRILHVIFEDALRYEWISKNPVDGIKIASSGQNLRPVEAKEVFSMEEAKEFVNILDNLPEEKRPITAAFKIMLFTGLRSAEMYGLRWADIDLEQRILHVKRNRLYNRYTGEYYEKCPKTPTSLRDVPIPEILYKELVNYKIWYMEKAKDLDTNPDKYYLMCNLHRKPASSKQLQDDIVEIRKKYKLKKHITCHGLRHTYCSLLLTQSIPIQTVSRYMGHSNSTVTLKVYTHFIPDTQIQFLETINKAFS